MAKTATKPAAKKGTAVATVKPKAVVSLAEMQAAIKADIESVAESTGSPSGDELRVGQNKMFKLPNGPEHPGPLNMVIVDFITVREFYDRPFDKANPSPAACSAASRTPTGMVPFKSSPDKQSNACTGCPMNEWETAPTGKGKACKEARVLAVIPDDATDETVPSILKVSPTALKPYDNYVRSIASSLNKAPFQVITEVSFDPNVDYPSLRFGNPTPASDELASIAFNLRGAARDRLLSEPDFSGYTPPKGNKAKAKAKR